MIYFDNNATTFLDPEVQNTLQSILCKQIGNPSSIHQYGQQARALLTNATRDIAHFFGVKSAEVIFTSGATEALNMVIGSIPIGRHIITSSLEHIAVMEALKQISNPVTYLDPACGKGAIDLSRVEAAMRPDTVAIVLMAANNETGIKTDLEAIASFASARGVYLIVDGVALLGKERWKIPDGVTAVCFSGHKVHAPSGIGVAIVRKPLKCKPLIVGGPQQHQKRGGTENMIGIVGFAAALSLIAEEKLDMFFCQMMRLRDRLEQKLLAQLPDIVVHGSGQPRVSNTSNIAFLGVDGETLLMQLDLAGVAVGYGSACSSGSLATSRVLLNMHIPAAVAHSSIRISLSRFTTEEEIDAAVAIITQVVTKLRTAEMACSFA